MLGSFAETILNERYAHTKSDGTKETWKEVAHRVANCVLSSVNASSDLISEVEEIIYKRKFIPAGRYLYASGREIHQTQNCLMLRAEDSREGWSELLYKASMALMTGAGIGVEYSGIRGKGELVKRTGGVCTGPLALIKIINEAGRNIEQGGARRGAMWAGLNWDHPDIFDFIIAKNWEPEVIELKKKNFDFPAQLDRTNISVGLDSKFFDAYHNESHPLHDKAVNIYWYTVRRMLKTGEPGFTVDVGDNAGEVLRNACTEVTSYDDSDICNLGSINLANIESIDEMRKVVELGTAFLLAGTVYSDVPYSKVREVRNKNRRLGLGLMGIHEWLIKRGQRYDIDEELEKYLTIYAQNTWWAKSYADLWNLSVPVKCRSIAPTGTTGIIAETTTGIEPIFCVAYKRRYLGKSGWRYQYIVDPTAQRLIQEGINPENIEDAYVLSQDIERRLRFQAWVQKFVDHGISSTINLPPYEEMRDKEKDFGRTLMKYLPDLRGVTVYPDGGRGFGQPINRIDYSLAVSRLGKDFKEESVDVCSIKGGSCGD